MVGLKVIEFVNEYCVPDGNTRAKQIWDACFEWGVHNHYWNTSHTKGVLQRKQFISILEGLGYMIKIIPNGNRQIICGLSLKEQVKE